MCKALVAMCVLLLACVPPALLETFPSPYSLYGSALQDNAARQQAACPEETCKDLRAVSRHVEECESHFYIFAPRSLPRSSCHLSPFSSSFRLGDATDCMTEEGDVVDAGVLQDSDNPFATRELKLVNDRYQSAHNSMRTFLGAVQNTIAGHSR